MVLIDYIIIVLFYIIPVILTIFWAINTVKEKGFLTIIHLIALAIVVLVPIVNFCIAINFAIDRFEDNIESGLNKVIWKSKDNINN